MYLKTDPTCLSPSHHQMLQQQYVEQKQQILQSQYLEQQQQIHMQQHLHHPQYIEQQQHLLQQQYMELQQQLLRQVNVQQEQHHYQTTQLNQATVEPFCSDTSVKCQSGRGRILKRVDLIPMQHCTI